MGEKTHQPTDRKLRDARKNGQIARSKLFSSAAVTLGGLLGGLSLAKESSARLIWWTAKVLSLQNLDTATAMNEAAAILAWCALPTVIGALVGALVTAVITAGFEVHLAALLPDLKRLDPAAGFKKLFTPKQLFEVAKSMVVAFITGLLVFSNVSTAAPLAFRSMSHEGGSALQALLTLTIPMLTKASGLLFVLGLADFALAKFRHRKELMMSHEDVKQEHKNSDGDPHTKSKRKAEHKKLSQGGPARGVKTATAIVVNPTHIAIAIRYDDAECDAPYIVAKGQEHDAMIIRREAKLLDIPIVKDVPFARTLIHCDVGEEVPEELYQAAAAILRVAQEESERQQLEKAGP